MPGASPRVYQGVMHPEGAACRTAPDVMRPEGAACRTAPDVMRRAGAANLVGDWHLSSAVTGRPSFAPGPTVIYVPDD